MSGPVFDIIKNNDVEKMKELISKNSYSAIKPIPNGYTGGVSPFFIMCSRDRPKILELYFDSEILSETIPDTSKLLLDSARFESVGMVNFLLDKGVDGEFSG